MRKCKINDLMKEKTATSILFILPGALAPLTPLARLIPFSLSPFALLSGSYIRSVLVTCPAQTSTFPRSPWCFPEIAGCLGASPRLPAALDLASVRAAISSSNASPRTNRLWYPIILPPRHRDDDIFHNRHSHELVIITVLLKKAEQNAKVEYHSAVEEVIGCSWRLACRLKNIDFLLYVVQSVRSVT